MLSCDAPERLISFYGTKVIIFSEISKYSQKFFTFPHWFLLPI